MVEIVALGESLMDMIPLGRKGKEEFTFEAKPGGATLNCMSQLSHLGYKTGYISRVGEDFFGRKLTEILQNEGIDTSCFTTTSAANTTLAFVHHDETGDRDFSFYRNPGADMMIEIGEAEEELIKNAKLLQLGTISMISGPAKKATMDAIKLAKEHGVKISFDPNFRLNLWPNEEELLEATSIMMPHADYLKISSEEILMFTGKENMNEAIEYMLENYDMKLISVTDGSNSTICSNRKHRVEVPAFSVKAVDTTGCGDSFTGSLLSRILKSDKNIEDWNEEDLREAVIFANAAGAITAQRRGGMLIMPREEEIKDFLSMEDK